MKKTVTFTTIRFILYIVICVTIILSVSYFFATTPKSKTEAMSNNTMSGFNDMVDIIYYINLDNRPDRNEEFLKEMAKYNIPESKIERIQAVYNPDRGHLGCAHSHIKALDRFIQSEHKTCVVFEDDFEFAQDAEYIDDVFTKLRDSNIKFDVCMLSGNVYEVDKTPTDLPFLQKAKWVLTTSGYMLTKEFAPALKENFMDGAEKLDKSYDEYLEYKDTQPEKYGYGYNGDYAIDQYWSSLQKKSDWYIFYPKLGKQRSSYSDIMKSVVNYNE